MPAPEKLQSYASGFPDRFEFFLGNFNLFTVWVSDVVVLNPALLGSHGRGSLFPRRLIDHLQHGKSDAVFVLQFIAPACFLDLHGTAVIMREVGVLDD